MPKTYYLKFGSGDPRTFTALSPTFVIFNANGVTAISNPPGISEMPSGSGIYQFIQNATTAYGSTIPYVFLADGGSALSSGDRYITGILDPVQAVDQIVGTTSDSFGTTSADPTSLMGYAKRNQEIQEGAQNYTKSTGVWDVSSRGSSTLLVEKTLTNTTTAATRS